MEKLYRVEWMNLIAFIDNNKASNRSKIGSYLCKNVAWHQAASKSKHAKKNKYLEKKMQYRFLNLPFFSLHSFDEQVKEWIDFFPVIAKASLQTIERSKKGWIEMQRHFCLMISQDYFSLCVFLFQNWQTFRYFLKMENQHFEFDRMHQTKILERNVR